MAEDTNYWSEVTDAELTALVPQVVLRELHDTGKLHFRRIDTKGVMMFIDVSGFSALSTKLQARSGGVDTLSAMLNQHLGDMINIIRNFEGDVLLFSGDALLVMWPSRDTSITQAVSCASHLQQHKYCFSDSEIAHTTVHIGITAGSYTIVILGGKGAPHLGKYRYTALGPAVTKAALALNLAKEGETVVDAKVHSVLSKSSHYEQNEVQSGYYRVKGDPVTKNKQRPHPVEQCGSELPLLTSLFFDTVAWCLSRKTQGELRTVSSVFIKLSSLDELPLDTAVEKLQTSVCLILKALSTSEGVLNKVAVDDKGWVVLCLFGLPLHTHEDDTDRSVKFALRVLSKVGKVAGRLTVGISRAKVYCGMTGSSLRHEYTALGDGVNIAARLMTKAHSMCTDSGIYTDEETYANCANSRRMGVEFRLVSAEGMLLKGSTDRVNVYEVEAFRPNEQGMTSVALEGIQDSDSGTESSLSNSSGSFRRLNGARAASLISNKTQKQRLRMRPSSDSILSDDSMNSRGSRGSRSSGFSPRPQRKLFASPRDRRTRISTKNSLQALSLTSSPESPSLTPQVIPISKQKLYGRNAEVNAMSCFIQGAQRKSMHDTLTEQHKILNLTGDTQSGMTSMIDAAEMLAASHGMYPLRISGLESAEFVSYYALVPIVMSFVESLSIQILELSVAAELRKHLPLLHHVTRLPGLAALTEEHTAMDPAEKVQMLNLILRLLIKKYNGERLLIIVDDAQWLDHLTLAFLLDNLNHGVKMVVANRSTKQGTYPKPHIDCETRSVSTHSTDHGVVEQGLVNVGAVQAAQFMNILQDTQLTYRVHLPRLQRIVVGAIVNSIFGSHRCDHALEHLIYEKSDSRPGFVVQISTALRFASLVDVKDRVARPNVSVDELQQMLVHTVPSIEAHIMKKLDTLGSHDRLVATLLAAINTCSKTTLEEVLLAYGSDLGMDDAIGNLVAADMVRVVESQIMFVMSMARDVIYYSSLVKEKRLLHSAVAKVIFNRPSYSDKEVASHVAASALSKDEVLAMFQQYYKAAHAKNDILGCMSALKRVPDIGTPEENYLKKLKITGLWNELGDVNMAKRVVLEILANRRSMFKGDMPTSNRLCACVPWFRSAKVHPKMFFKLQYHVLQLELNMWCCEGEAGQSRLEILTQLTDRLPVKMTGFFAAAGLVFHKKRYAQISESYPFTLFAGVASWDCLTLLPQYLDCACPSIRALPVTWLEEDGTIVKPTSKYAPMQYWRPSLRGLAHILHCLTRVFLGEPVVPLSEHCKGKWEYYHSIISTAAVELCLSTEVGSFPILRVGDGKCAWTENEPNRHDTCSEDTITGALVSCLKACSLAAGTWNVRNTHTVVKNAMQVATPFHGLILWLFSEALLTTSKRSSMGGGSPSSGVLTHGSGASLVTSETTSSDEHKSSFSDMPSAISNCAAMYSRLAELYPIVSLSFHMQMGELCEYESEAQQHYREVVERSNRLGAPMCPLAWRARARLLLAEEDSVEFLCKDTSFDHTKGRAGIAAQMLKQMAGHPVLASNEGKELECEFANEAA